MSLLFLHQSSPGNLAQVNRLKKERDGRKDDPRGIGFGGNQKPLKKVDKRLKDGYMVLRQFILSEKELPVFRDLAGLYCLCCFVMIIIIII